MSCSCFFSKGEKKKKGKKNITTERALRPSLYQEKDWLSSLKMIPQAALLGTQAAPTDGLSLPTPPFCAPRPPRSSHLTGEGAPDAGARCYRPQAGSTLPCSPQRSSGGKGFILSAFKGESSPALRHPPALCPQAELVQGLSQH